MKLSQKRKIVSHVFLFFFEFPKFRFNFKHFRKKYDPQSLSIFELTDSERRGY